jgi:hypothetical protein
MRLRSLYARSLDQGECEPNARSITSQITKAAGAFH